MPLYFGKQTTSSDQASDRYVCINNCGFFENMSDMRVQRPEGRLDYQLIYIKSGEIVFERSHGQCALGAGHIVLYRPHEPQHYRIQQVPTTFFWIHFTGREIADMLSFFTDDYCKIEPFPEFERFCNAFYIDQRFAGRYNELRYEGKLITLFARLSELIYTKRSRDCSKINKAVLAMHSAFPQKQSNTTLANLCGLSKYYFIKLFKAATDLTPQQYYAVMVIDKSKQLLENTGLSVGEIAAQCGMEDSLYFSRMFKKHTGRAPSDYRKEKQSP